MKLLYIFMSVLAFASGGKSLISIKKVIRIAVIDTGFGTGNNEKVPLCKTGHWNFVGNNSNIKDYHSHGTNVTGIIHKQMANVNHCFIILKFYHKEIERGTVLLSRSTRAFKRAVELNVDYVNFSAGGSTPSQKEFDIIKSGIKKGIHFIVAAGNNHTNLSIKCNYFPACYSSRFKHNFTVVGALEESGGGKLSSSNYNGPVKRWEIGQRVKVFGIQMSGSSQATATATGKIASKIK